MTFSSLFSFWQNKVVGDTLSNLCSQIQNILQYNFRSPFKAVRAVVFPSIIGDSTDRSTTSKGSYLARYNKKMANLSANQHLPKINKDVSLAANRSLMKKRYYSDSDVTGGFEFNNTKPEINVE